MKRIGDNEIAPFGRGSIVFQRSDNGELYEVVFDDEVQDEFLIISAGRHLRADVQRKYQSEAGFVIMGMLVDKEGVVIDEGAAWLELILGERISLVFWGNGVVLREDAPLDRDEREQLRLLSQSSKKND